MQELNARELFSSNGRKMNAFGSKRCLEIQLMKNSRLEGGGIIKILVTRVQLLMVHWQGGCDQRADDAFKMCLSEYMFG